MKRLIALTILMFLPLPVVAHDSDRIDQLERDVQETKDRLSTLESKLQNKTNEKKHVTTGNGWESVANWRKLATGMDPSTVQKILGEPQRVDGGKITFWSYENGGSVTFYQGKVDSWSEPPR